MKKITFLTLALLILETIAFAEEPSYIPNYYAQSEFLSTSPGVAGDVCGAFFNPAIWGVLRSPQVQFFWNDLVRKPGDRKYWSLISGVKGLGFGMQHWSFDDTLGLGNYREKCFYDYNIALGMGDEFLSYGLGYSWAKGYIPDYEPRDNILSMGFLSRPVRQVSVGIAGHYALSEQDMRGIVDLGVRPLGKPWLTLFGDAALSNKQSFKELDWGAGLALEPVTGIYCNGKFFHGGAFMLGLSVSLGGAKLSFIPHFDQNSKQTYNTYGVGLLSKPPIDIVTKASMRDKFYLQMDLDKPLKYQRYKLFDRGGMTLMEMLRVLEDAKNDPRIAGVALNISEDLMSSYEMLWEVREKLKEVKDAGKKVLVYLERGGMGHYYLASVADKIMVDPDCIVTMMGFNMGRTFYRNMLDKLGIGVDEWRFFKYKSAAESYSRSSMSEADKEQRKALIDGFYSTMRADICASRGISEMDFDNIVDNLGIITADSLIAYKLADTTGRWDDMKEIIKGVEGKGKGISGIKILTSVQLKEAEWGKPPQIAVIYGLGECAMNSGINARQLQKTIKSVRENKQIKAVVFRADSPGGDILPSDIVTMELKKTAEKKPVIVSQGQVAGSGGYWISMYGDTIVASPWTITGSIGVIGMFLYNNGFGDKLGLTYDHTQVGKHADLGYGIVLPLIGAMIPERNLNTEERLYVETTIKKWYKEFVKKVAEGRNLTEEKVDEIGQGRVWTGTAGKEIGLVDVLGGMEISIDLARKAANIPPERDIEIVELPEKGWFDPAMFAPKLLGIQQQPLFKVNEYDPEMQYLKMIIQANGKPLLMMPPDFYID